MKKVSIFVFVMVLCLAMLAGCSSSVKSANSSTALYDTAYEVAPQESSSQTEMKIAGTGTAHTTGIDVTQPQDNRKIIRNANLTVEALEFETTLQAVQIAVNDTNGYISASNADNSVGRGWRTAQYTCRIPAENYSQFMQTVQGTGNVIFVQENTQDVTTEYFDVQARIDSLKKQEERLFVLMEQAGTLENLIAVQQQLTDVQYQINSYESQMRSLQDRIADCTVVININEVQNESQPVGNTFSTRVRSAFVGMWQAVVAFCQGSIISLIYMLPLVIVSLVIAGIVIICVLRAKNKRKKLMAQMQANIQPPVQTNINAENNPK